VDENEEPDDSNSESEPEFSAEAPLDQHHLGCINLGQYILVPYQLSASSYATDRNNILPLHVQVAVSILCLSNYYNSTQYYA